MNTDDQHDFLSPRRGPTPLTPSDLAEQLATDYPQLSIHPDAPFVGGMGAVYSATLTTSAGPHHVAIKVLHWHLMDDPAFTARFQREQALLRQLDHPNIVKLHFTGHTAEGLPFLVMDWIAGRSLTEFTQPGSTTDRHHLLRIADDLCAATQHAHEQGILHRDLKPQNIIVTQDGRAIVLDFGIARSLRPGHTLTQPGDAPGTHGYIAPEVLAGEKPDARADIYSLGIIIYQLLMKKLPDVFAARPSEHSLDPRFDEIVMKAAAAEREKRYASAEALRGALESIRQTGKPEPLSMNNEITNTRPDPKSIVIEYDDDWITINGRVFSHEPFVSDVVSVLGEPVVEADGGRYCWPELGIEAESATLWESTALDNAPWLGDETRDQRIKVIQLILSVQNLSDQSKHRFTKMDNPPFRPFSGVLRLCGLTLKRGWTLRELCRMKSGVPLEINPSGRYAHTRKGDLETGFVLVASEHRDEFENQPAEVFHLYFERWNQPTMFMRDVPLAAGEFILNSCSSRDAMLQAIRQLEHEEKRSTTDADKKRWRKWRSQLSKNGLYRDHYFLDIVVTNRRALVQTNDTHGLVQIPLSKAPSIRANGWTSTKFIINGEIAEWIIPTILAFLVSGGCAAAFYSFRESSDLLHQVVQGVAALVGLVAAFVGGCGLLEFRKYSNDLAREYILSANGMSDLLLIKGWHRCDHSMRSDRPMEVLIHRLRAAVARYGKVQLSDLPSPPDFATSEKGEKLHSSYSDSSPNTQAQGSLPWYFVTMTCGCRVHLFAPHCKDHGSPNITPKLLRWTAQGVGLLGGYGFLFGGHDNRELSLLAIGVSVVAIVGLKIATALFRVDHQ